MHNPPTPSLRPVKIAVIEAGHVERQYWSDLWQYRELLYFLALRDISVRYRQTFFGIAWVVMRPLLTMIVFTLLFSKVAGLSSGSMPYPVMVFAAMLPWQLFASTLADSGNSIVNNGSMISKVYFPRLLMPLATVAVGLVDFLVAAVLLVPLMVWYHVVPDWRLLTLPLFLLIGLATSLGAGLWVAALNVKYRDFRFIVAFALQLALYISPVGFSSEVIPQAWRLWYSLNPLVGVIDGFRWALLGGEIALYWPGIAFSVLSATLLLLSAVVHFRRTEKSFADDI